MECGAINAMKRQNVKRDIDSSILDRFWDLVDISDEKRSRTAEQLLTALLLKQPSVNIGAWGRHSEGPPIANPNPTLTLTLYHSRPSLWRPFAMAGRHQI